MLPARVAGVEEIIMVTPPGADGSVSYPLVLAAADLAGGVALRLRLLEWLDACLAALGIK